MTLRDYLAAEKLSFSEFGRRIGTSHETVRRYVSGDRTPHWRIMQKIVLVTGAKVTANDFLERNVAA